MKSDKSIQMLHWCDNINQYVWNNLCDNQNLSVPIWIFVVLLTRPSSEDEVFIWFCSVVGAIKFICFLSCNMCCSSSNDILLMTSQRLHPYDFCQSVHQGTLTLILIAFTLPNLKTPVKYFKKEKETPGELGDHIIQWYLLRALT